MEKFFSVILLNSMCLAWGIREFNGFQLSHQEGDIKRVKYLQNRSKAQFKKKSMKKTTLHYDWLDIFLRKRHSSRDHIRSKSDNSSPFKPCQGASRTVNVEISPRFHLNTAWTPTVVESAEDEKIQIHLLSLLLKFV